MEHLKILIEQFNVYSLIKEQQIHHIKSVLCYSSQTSLKYLPSRTYYTFHTFDRFFCSPDFYYELVD